MNKDLFDSLSGCTLVKVDSTWKSNYIGSGGFGTVYQYTFHGTPTALKVVKPESSTELTKESIEDFIKECKLIRTFKHENIVQYMATALVTDENGFKYPGLLMSLMTENLREHLNNPSATPLPKYKEITIAHGIAKGLNYLHVVEKFAHGDLHVRNVLLKFTTAIDGPLVKICDFGIKKVVKQVSRQHCQFNTSADYTNFELPENLKLDHYSRDIPESIATDSVAELNEGIARDILSFGVIMWQIHTRMSIAYRRTSECLKIIEQHPGLFHGLVKKCWSINQPPVKQLFKDIKSLEIDNPRPHVDTVQETILSQVAYINTLENKNQKLSQENTELRDENAELKQQIKNLTDKLTKLRIST